MRKFLYLPSNTRIAIEAYFNDHRARLELQLGGDESEIFLLSISIPFIFRFYFQLSNWRLSRWLKVPQRARNTGFYLHWPLFHVEIWQKMHEWRRGDWSWSVDLEDLVFGKAVHEKVEQPAQEIIIPMPEGDYSGTATLYDEWWSRPRGNSIHKSGVFIEVPDGVPHPGKGTSSYNLSEDGLVGAGFEVETVDEAVQRFVERVNWYRTNYPL